MVKKWLVLMVSFWILAGGVLATDKVLIKVTVPEKLKLNRGSE